MPPLESLSRGAAFAPGHVTGFFEIHDKAPEPARRGSRGAGFSVDMGAVSYVEVEPADRQEVTIFLDKERVPADGAPVTRAAVRHLLHEAAAEGKVGYDREAPRGERAKARVVVHSDLQLPISQGFGMSAAGALSTSLALARALGIGRSAAVAAAHVADVEEKGGLGDVVAAAQGGFEVRVAPGLPPHGSVRKLVGFGKVVLCVLGGKDARPLETKAILRDREKRKAINAHGGRSVDALLQNPNLDNFLTLSRAFAESTGLMTPELMDAADACRGDGMASMAMLGNSLFAIGRTEALKETLEEFGEVFVADIDERGARPYEVEVANWSARAGTLPPP